MEGIKGGIKLETILVGGKRFTSVEAIERFVARLSDPQAASQHATDHTEADRRTEEELKRRGY